MKTVLVDTSVIIEYLRCSDKKNTMFYKTFKTGKYKAVVSLVTITELWAGKSMQRKKVQNKIKSILGHCQVVVPDISLAKQAGQILRESDYEVSYQDAQIAAAAIANHIPILTLNEKDFINIEGLEMFSLSF